VAMIFFRRSMIKLIILILTLAAIISLRYNGEFDRLTNSSRELSIDLGGGQCKWTAPIYDVPTDTKFFKTLIAGFPSGDKRLTFVQMEALTGLSTRDEWDFEFLGATNQPFVKANYPHHEGIWGWEGVQLGQVAMIVRNIKRSLVEYHDILWDIGYAQTFDQAFENIENLYQERPPLEDFLKWRDIRIFDEIHWYSWFIDYYMEEGLMRDMFNHEQTTPEHWRKIMLPNHFTKEELRYKWYISDPTIVSPNYDPMCATIEKGCYPVSIISAEKLVVPETGPAEGRKIAELINGKEGFDDYMIDEKAWDCIWNELIINKRGLKTFIDRDGLREESYDFSFEMFNEMWYELDRLITKYGGKDDQVAKDLVELLEEHQDSLGITPAPFVRMSYEELMTYHLELKPFFPHQKPLSHHTDAYFPHQVAFNSTFLRNLKVTDILGPKTRAMYEKMNKNEDEGVSSDENRKRDVVVSEEHRKMGVKEKFDFSKFDEVLKQHRLDQIKNMKDLFGF